MLRERQRGREEEREGGRKRGREEEREGEREGGRKRVREEERERERGSSPPCIPHPNPLLN